MHVSQPDFDIDSFLTYQYELYERALNAAHNGLGVWATLTDLVFGIG